MPQVQSVMPQVQPVMPQVHSAVPANNTVVPEYNYIPATGQGTVQRNPTFQPTCTNCNNLPPVNGIQNVVPSNSFSPAGVVPSEVVNEAVGGAAGVNGG